MSNRTQLLIRLSPELKQAITAKASSQGVPLNQWAVQVLAAALEHPDSLPDSLPDISDLAARLEAIEARLALGTDSLPDTRTDTRTDIQTDIPPAPAADIPPAPAADIPDLKSLLSQLRRRVISPEDALTLIPHPHPPGLRSLLGKVRNSRLSQADALVAIQNYQN